MKAYVYHKKRKKLSKRTKCWIAVFSFASVFSLLCVYYFSVITPIIVTLSEEKVRSMSTQVISQSISDVMSAEGLSYDDLITIIYDKNDKISLINTNSINVNLLVRKVTKQVQEDIDALTNTGIKVALGTFTGIPFLFGVGPLVSLNLVPVGTVNTKFDSSFTSAGINQTLHRLYFSVSVNIGMVLPSLTKNFITSLDVALCESIIVGEVPEIYFQGKII